MSQPAPYTADDKAKVAELLRQGLSTAKIAPLVGRSRNSVLGIIHRHPELKPVAASKPHAMSIKASRKQGGIKGGKPAKILPQNLVAKKAARAKDPKFVHRAAAAKDARMVPLETLEPRDGCRFIFGEPSTALYCGLPGFPWCEGHRRLVYTPAIVRRAAA